MDYMPLTNVQTLSAKSWERSSSRATPSPWADLQAPLSAARTRQQPCPWFWHLGVSFRLVLFLSCFYCSVRPPAANVPITPLYCIYVLHV